MTRDVTLGPPPESCAHNIKSHFDQVVGPLAYVTGATTLVTIVLFIVHFGLYKKEPKEAPTVKFISEMPEMK